MSNYYKVKLLPALASADKPAGRSVGLVCRSKNEGSEDYGEVK